MPFPLLGGCNIKGEDDSWDFGTGAGFYVNATEDPWKTNYRMYSYVTEEVIQLSCNYWLMTNESLVFVTEPFQTWEVIKMTLENQF